MTKSAGSFLSGISEVSRKTERLVPAEHGLTQAWVIGQTARDMFELSDDAIAELVYAEVQRLIPGYPDKYLFHRVVRKRHAMSTCYPGYLRDHAKFSQQIGDVQGLSLINDYRSNPLIEASVHLGEQVARRIEKGTA